MNKAPHPALLPVGTRVGPWRVVAWAGSGVHGAIYRAVPFEAEHDAPVAIKVAMLPRDPRFAREEELLSRVRNSSVPRLVDSGEWQHPNGALHPYIVMEWIDGTPLYDWARLHPPSHQQVLRWLAQLASALQAIHAQSATHRDVKGDNILVRHSDGRAMLTDFGSCNYPGTVTLTPPASVPGTPAYRSPEASLLELHSIRQPAARHLASPADDIYALGVTACRLITGEYVEPGEPAQDEHGTWYLPSLVIPPSLYEAEPELRALILRMLSLHPEERGTAAQLAEALKLAAGHRQAVSAPPPRVEPAPPARPQAQPAPPVVESSAALASSPQRLWGPMAASLAVGICAGWMASSLSATHQPSTAQSVAVSASPPAEGTRGLGEEVSPASMQSASRPPTSKAMAQDTLPEPLEGQAQPDAKGRCPHKKQVALNGGCWAVVSFSREDCEDNGGSIFKAACYLPVIPPGRRPPTSAPPPKR